MKLVAAFSKSWFVVAVLCLLNAHLVVGQSNALGDNGGVIRFDRTLGPGYDVCNAKEWEMVRELLDHFAPRMVVAEPRDLRAASCKTCGKLCFYSGSGCPHRSTIRRLAEDNGDNEGNAPSRVNQPADTDIALDSVVNRVLAECKPNCAEDDECCNSSCQVMMKLNDLEKKADGARCKAWVASGTFWCNTKAQV